MWKKPYGYAEGFAVCAGLFLTGLLLQFINGKTGSAFLTFPYNLISGGIIAAVPLAVFLFFRKSAFYAWLSSVKSAIPAIISLLVLVVIMGLTRQAPSSETLDSGVLERIFGFSQMTSSWAFSLLMVFFMIILLLVILKRITAFRWRDTGFMLNHSGLFIALFSAIFGSGDLQRLSMTVQKGQMQWQAQTEKGETVELPLAIELKQFTIYEYPPKLMILDNLTGKALPENNPENLLVERSPMTGELAGWNIRVSKYLQYAGQMVTGDTVRYFEYHSEGAVDAVYASAENRKTGAKAEGWVSCGNFMFPFAALQLNDKASLIMPPVEPRRYSSDVTVYQKDDKTVEGVVEVNRPLAAGGWKIYQSSYDQTMGRWSEISIFQLVRDPWLPYVYAGIFMMLAGALWLFIFAPKKLEE